MADSLFGLDPAQVAQALRAQREQQAMQIAQLDPMQQLSFGTHAAAANLGDSIGGMLGGVNPMVARARQMQDIQRSALGDGAFGTEGFFRGAMNRLAGAGFSNEAMGMQKALDERRKTDADIELKKAQTGQANRRDFDPEYLKYMTALEGMQKARDGLPEGSARDNLDERIQMVKDRLKHMTEFKPANNAGTQTERMLAKLQAYQSKVNNGGQLTEEEALDAATTRRFLSQPRVFTDPVTQQTQIIQPFQFPPEMTVGSGGAGRPAASGSGFTAPGAPTQEAPRKPLPEAEVKALNDNGTARGQLVDIITTFDPKYTGYGVEAVANAAIEAGRRIPPDWLKMLPGDRVKTLNEGADWWQSYRQWAADVRSGKFGLTLTPSEEKNFTGYTPQPTDQPEIIQKNLNRQLDLVTKKIIDRLNASAAGGYNDEQAVAATGLRRQIGSDQPLQSPKMKGEAPTTPDLPVVKDDADWERLKKENKIPIGGQFVAPDGRVMTRKR